MDSKAVYPILYRAIKGELPERIDMKGNPKEVGLYAALIREGYLKGRVTNNADGVPVRITAIRLTPRGKQFAEKLIKDFGPNVIPLRFSRKVMIVIALTIGLTGTVLLVLTFKLLGWI